MEVIRLLIGGKWDSSSWDHVDKILKGRTGLWISNYANSDKD